jgi:DNA-binding XRE family transcriptional regulator
MKKHVTKDSLIKMINYAYNGFSLKHAYLKMIRSKECKPYSYEFYMSRLSNLQEYKDYLEAKKQHWLEINENILYYYNNHPELNQRQIAKKIGVSQKKVVCVINENYEYYPPEITRAKKIVDYWNNYSYEGRFMVDETKEAFKTLKLKVPE